MKTDSLLGVLDGRKYVEEMIGIYKSRFKKEVGRKRNSFLPTQSLFLLGISSAFRCVSCLFTL